MSFENFQDGRYGGHLGYRNRTILAILNLYVALMPPIKFRLNPTYGLGGNYYMDTPSYLELWSSKRLLFSQTKILIFHFFIKMYVAGSV